MSARVVFVVDAGCSDRQISRRPVPAVRRAGGRSGLRAPVVPLLGVADRRRAHRGSLLHAPARTDALDFCRCCNDEQRGARFVPRCRALRRSRPRALRRRFALLPHPVAVRRAHRPLQQRHLRGSGRTCRRAPIRTCSSVPGQFRKTASRCSFPPPLLLPFPSTPNALCPFGSGPDFPLHRYLPSFFCVSSSSRVRCC